MECQHKKSWPIWKWVLTILIALLAVYLLIEHRFHIMGRSFEILLIGLILLCPLMHLFMHHGHNHQKHDDGHVRDDHKQRDK